MSNLNLEYINNNPNSIIDYLTQIWKEDEPDYKEFLDTCMKIVTGSDNPESFFKELTDRKLLNFGACETKWSFGDSAYKCRTCQLDPTSALCTACFKEGDHEGHDYALQSVGGGFCDCGDPAAFKPSGFCTRHKEQKIDITKYPERFTLALSFVTQFMLKKIYLFYDKNNKVLFEMFIEWLLKIAQRGDIIKVVVIKYISNTDIGNTHLLPPSPFVVPLIQLFYSPDLHQGVSRSMKETIANFCVFLRGSVEFIESFIRLMLPIYKKCIIECKKHILLSSYSIFSSQAVGDLFLNDNAAEIVMDTITTYFSKYFYYRNDCQPLIVNDQAGTRHVNKKKQQRFIDPYFYPQYKVITKLHETPVAVNVLRTDISFILGNANVASSVINSNSLLSLWINLIGISQGMNPNIKSKVTSVEDWVPAFNIDISFSNTIFSIVNAIQQSKSNLDQVLLYTTQYLGKWILGWLEYRNNHLIKKQEKQLKQAETEASIGIATTTTTAVTTISPNFIENIKQILSMHSLKREGFSFHLPIHRLVSAILYKCINNVELAKEYREMGGLKKLFSQMVGESSPIGISDYARGTTYHPFKILSSLGEIKSGMWRSNGREEDMSLQAVVYQSLHYQKYFDLDIFLIQVGSVIMGSNQFIKHALNVYNLDDWFTIEQLIKNDKDETTSTPTATTSAIPPTTPTKPSLRQSIGGINTTTVPSDEQSATIPTTTTTTTTTGTPKKETKEERKIRKEKQRMEEDLQKKKSLSEDFLQNVIMLATNRLMCGMTEDQVIRKELIHRLCLGDNTHSQLTRVIKKKLVNSANFEPILKEISIFHNPQKTEQGKYQLKEQCWSEFDPYFAHYNTQDLQAAEEKYSEFQSKTKSNIARGTYTMYSTSPCFEELDQILCSRLLHQILFTVLQNQLVASNKSTDTIFTHALHALEICIAQTLSTPELKAETLASNTAAAGAPNATPSKLVKSTSSTLNSSMSVPSNFKDIELPSKSNIFLNAFVDVQVSEQKRLSMIILLVKLTTSQQITADHKQQIQNIINTLMENNLNCKQTVEGYWAAIKAKKQPQSARKEDPEEEKKRLARARQAAILAQMKTQQSAFKFEEGDDDDDYEDDDYSGSVGGKRVTSPTSGGTKQQQDKKPKVSNALFVDGCESTTTCALCREPGSLDRPMGRVAFIQPSSILMLSKLTPEERKQRMTEALMKDLYHDDSTKSKNQGGVTGNETNGDVLASGVANPNPNVNTMNHGHHHHGGNVNNIGGLNGLDYILPDGEEMDDEDLGDVDMAGGEDDEDDSEDEVNKAISFLNRVSNEFVGGGFGGFDDGMMDIEGGGMGGGMDDSDDDNDFNHHHGHHGMGGHGHQLDDSDDDLMMEEGNHQFIQQLRGAHRAAAGIRHGAHRRNNNNNDDDDDDSSDGSDNGGGDDSSDSSDNGGDDGEINDDSSDDEGNDFEFQDIGSDDEDYLFDDSDDESNTIMNQIRGTHGHSHGRRTGNNNNNIGTNTNATNTNVSGSGTTGNYNANEIASTLLRALERIPPNQTGANFINEITSQLSQGNARVHLQARDQMGNRLQNIDFDQLLSQLNQQTPIVSNTGNNRATVTMIAPNSRVGTTATPATTATTTSPTPATGTTISNPQLIESDGSMGEEDISDDDDDLFGDDEFFDDEANDDVLLKFDAATEPVTGKPWSNKFSKQEIFRNTEESVNLNLSFCGHQIHESCFSEYSWSLLKNNEGGELVDPEQSEFLCVLCRRIGNAIVPVVPDSGFCGHNHGTVNESAIGDNQPYQIITPEIARKNSKNQDINAYSEFYHHLGTRLMGKDEQHKKSLDAPNPQSLRNLRQAIDQYATRVYGVRYNLNFYKSKSDATVVPFMCSSLASTIAGTELSIRVPDNDDQSSSSSSANNSNVYPLFSMTDSNRVDIRSLFRYMIIHSHMSPPFLYQGQLLWNSISGSHNTSLLPTQEEEDELQLQKDLKEKEERDKELAANGGKESKKSMHADREKMIKLYPEIENQGVYAEAFPPFLSLDLFHTFIQIFLRYSDTNLSLNVEKFYMVARMFYDASITQSILQHFKTTDSAYECQDEFINTVNNLITTTYETITPILAIPQQHLIAIKTNCLVFLRRISIFLFSCLKIDPISSASASSNGSSTSLESEINYLVDYLNLPSFDQHCLSVLNAITSHSDLVVPLVSMWCEQLLFISAVTSSTEDSIDNNTTTTTTTTTTSDNNNNQQIIPTTTKKVTSILPSSTIPNPFLLIKLPEQYNIVSQYYSSIPCIQCKTISNNQAVCLICGTLCCLGGCCKRFFDQKSECVLHAERCNAGTGIFLLIKTSSTLLIHLPRKTHWISPYLDDHGEEDQNLRRGRPLILNANRYNQLNSLLVKHQIDQDSKIAEHSSREF